MFFVVPESVIVRPNVTEVALALMVRLEFGLLPLGGFAATAGPAQTSTSASAALSFFIPHKRGRAAQVGYKKKKRRPEAPLSSARCAGRRRRTPRSAAGIRGRGRGRRVLEFLFGTEERVECLLAQAFAQGERRDHADDQQQHSAPAALRLLRRAQAVGRVLEGRRRFAQLL